METEKVLTLGGGGGACLRFLGGCQNINIEGENKVVPGSKIGGGRCFDKKIGKYH